MYFMELYNDNLIDLFYVLDNKKNAAAMAAMPKLDIKVGRDQGEEKKIERRWENDRK